MKNSSRISLSVLLLSLGAGSAMAADDCVKVSVSTQHAVAADGANLLEIVEQKVSASPGCACEIVKAAIEAAESSPKEVASIVETAASAAPEHMRQISQCALAVAPDAFSEVQMVMARLEPGQGEEAYSAKSSKSPKEPIVEVKPAWNPLDFPGQGPVGPNPGGPGGYPILPPGVPPGVPPVVNPPAGTETDPTPQ